MTDLELQKFVTLYKAGDEDPMYVVTNDVGIEYHQFFVDEGTNGLESGLFYMHGGWDHCVDHSKVFFTYEAAKQYTDNNKKKMFVPSVVGLIEDDLTNRLLRTDIKITSDMHLFTLLKHNFVISPSEGVYWNIDKSDNVWMYYTGEGGWRRCGGLVLDGNRHQKFSVFAIELPEI